MDRDSHGCGLPASSEQNCMVMFWQKTLLEYQSQREKHTSDLIQDTQLDTYATIRASRPDCLSTAPAALRPPLTRSAIATRDPPRSIDSTRPSTSLSATGGSASGIESPRVTTAPPHISTTRCTNSRPLRLNRTTSPGR